MRLGGPIFDKPQTPQQWIEALAKAGYTAAFAPPLPDTDEATVAAWMAAAREADVVIAEVGAWSNPIDPDPARAEAAFDKCVGALRLADRLGARCCVNVVGSRHPEHWAGPHPDNLTDETFDLVVRTTQRIIDTAAPTRSCYTLETMPWIFPDSVDSYVRLAEAIDREHFAVHLDPVNLVNCPARCFDTTALLNECFDRLGPRIRSCHAKDTLIQRGLTVHIDEVQPGLGVLDYATFLRRLDELDPDTPLMLEHLKTAEEYRAAAAYIRGVAAQAGVTLR